MGHLAEAGLVAGLRPRLFPQPNGHHLHNAALIRAAERRMGFHPVYHNDAVSLKGVLVDADMMPLAGIADVHRLHGREDGAAEIFLRDAIGVEHLQLSLRRGAAVAAHGRHNKGAGPTRADKVCNAFGNQRNIGNAAAPRRNGYAHPRLNLLPVIGSGKSLAYRLRDVLGGNPGPVKNLPDRGHFGNRGIGTELRNNAHT